MAKDKDKKGLINEFKEFISRGNVLDMAVGIIIGSAFTAIVTSLVNDIIMPVVGIIIGGVDFSNMKLVIGSGDDPAMLTYGAFIQSIINFLIVAMCVFAIIKVINTFAEKAKKLKKAEEVKAEEAAPAAPPEPTKEELLLAEIRDLLKAQNKE